VFNIDIDYLIVLDTSLGVKIGDQHTKDFNIFYKQLINCSKPHIYNKFIVNYSKLYIL
jgi:hypothetical protein